MARRVLAGKATYSGSTKYGIWISKEGVDVTTTATGNTVTDPKNLLFNSVTARTGQLYAGGNISSASAEIPWTSGSKPTLTYIPAVIFVENWEYVDIDWGFNLSGGAAEQTRVQRQINANSWRIKHDRVQPGLTEFDNNISTDASSYPATAPNRVAVSSRTSTNSKFLVLRIPCAYGYMGTTAYYPNGATYSVSNHPTLGDTDDLW